MNRQHVTQGIVLRRTNFGEADRIITVLSQDQGKIRLVAKGVRRIKSKLAGGIELFSVNSMTYIVGKGDLSTLVSARLTQHFNTIIDDISRTMLAYDLLKVIDRITEDNSDDVYFTTLCQTLDAINQSVIPIPSIKLWFYLQLLLHNGHQPNVATSVDGSPLHQSDKFTFSLEDMAFVPHASGVFDARAVKLMRLGLASHHPRQLALVADSQELQLQLVDLVRAMHAEHGQQL